MTLSISFLKDASKTLENRYNSLEVFDMKEEQQRIILFHHSYLFFFFVCLDLVPYIGAIILVDKLLHILPILIDSFHPLFILDHFLAQLRNLLFVHVAFIAEKPEKLLFGQEPLSFLINQSDHLHCRVQTLVIALFLQNRVKVLHSDDLLSF